MAKKKILLDKDNAREHTCVFATAKFDEIGYECLQHIPYSPDLAPSSYFEFPNFQHWLGRCFCVSNNEVIVETNAYFEGLVQQDFEEGIQNTEKSWTKSIKLEGEILKNKIKIHT